MKFEINVLDHGNIKLLNIANAIPREGTIFDGQDQDPAIVARQCFGAFNEQRAIEQDLKLVRHLEANKHTSCLEMTEFWFSMKLPLFVAEQFKRHRSARFLEHEEAQSYLSPEVSMFDHPTVNQTSGRYVTLPEEWYIPEIVGGKAKNMKQGQEDNLDQDTQTYFKLLLEESCHMDYKIYLNAIEHGVAPEHARLFLHYNHYTQGVWKQDLHNLLHFMSLRVDSHAQIEARAYGNAMYKLIKQVLPRTMQLFDEYRRLDLLRLSLTKEELDIILQLRNNKEDI